MDVLPRADVHASSEGLGVSGWRGPGGVVVGDRLAASAEIFDGLPGGAAQIETLPEDLVLPVQIVPL